MKPTVVFLVYHGFGHFNACFKIAKSLTDEYNVIFAGHAFFQKHVTQQGFNFYPLKTVPFGMGFERWVNTTEKKSNIYWSALKDRWHNRLYLERKSELEKAVSDLRPDYLFIDSWQCTDLIALYPYLKDKAIRVAFIQTMVSTVVDKDIPPANSLVYPGDKIKITKAYTYHRINHLTKQLVFAVKWFGKHDSTLIRYNARKNAIPKHLRSGKKSLHGLPIFNIDEFILSPAEFDFASAKRLPFQHYIGFQTDNNRIQPKDEEYLNAIETINKIRNKYPYLLYCSFGSVAHETSKDVKRFLERLIEAAKKLNAICLITINNAPLVKEFTGKNENVFALQSAPQLDVLSFADVFISHGGLNSIREAIDAEVPLLVYPGIVNTDLNGNASRVVYSRIGLRGNLRRDTPEDIAFKIHELLSNNIYTQNIGTLKKIDQHYDIRKFKELVARLMPFKDIDQKKIDPNNS
jgi:zeaxanthin glucosyltransferase